MKKLILWSVVFVGTLSVAAMLKGAERKITLPGSTPEFKPGPGSELATAQCSLCHSSDYITIQPKFPIKVWKAEVTKMQQKYGAPIPTNNIDEIAEYLTRSYGKESPAETPKK